jgi:hypothetical protein
MAARDSQLWGRSRPDPRIATIKRIIQREYDGLRLTEKRYACLMQSVASTVANYDFAKAGDKVNSIGFPDLTPKNFLSQELMGYMKLPFAVADEIRDALDYVRVDELLVW